MAAYFDHRPVAVSGSGLDLIELKSYLMGKHNKVSYLQTPLIVAQHGIIVVNAFHLEVHNRHAPMHPQMDRYKKQVITEYIHLGKKERKNEIFFFFFFFFFLRQ